MTFISPSMLLMRAPQVLTSGTSFTKLDGCRLLVVEAMGGGGGGGSADTAAGETAAGGGGASGAYARKMFDVSAETGPFTYAIGAAGSGEVAGGAGATSGGNTTFTVDGVTVNAKGGSTGLGSSGGNLYLLLPGENGNLATGGDINGNGEAGEYGISMNTAVSVIGIGGRGGSSFFGGGGQAVSNTGAGNDGKGFGAGGSGALSLNASGAVDGGDGAQGVIIVWEFA